MLRPLFVPDVPGHFFFLSETLLAPGDKLDVLEVVRQASRKELLDAAAVNQCTVSEILYIKEFDDWQCFVVKVS